MRKIGLAVCYDTKNFGSQLQVLATIKAVENFGFEYEIIRYKKKLTIPFLIQQLPRVFNSYFLRSKINSFKKKLKLKKYPEIYKNVCIRDKNFLKFAQIYFTNLSEVYYGWKDLKKGAGLKYDLYLCGSDQLWLPNNLGSHFFTLEFAPDNKRKIAYATSFGVGQIPWYQKNRTKKYLERFEYLSTREITGQEIIGSLTGKVVPVVCDPTLLLSGQDWERIIPKRKIIEGKYIFCYFLGTNDRHREYAEELQRLTGLSIVTIPFLDNFNKSDLNFGDKSLFDVDSADFVNLIRNAEYVLTDSFHGTVFSIINHKKFLTFSRFGNKVKNSRNSRIISLLQVLNLQERHFDDGDIILKLEKPIDYHLVDLALEDFKMTSWDYLKNSLCCGYEKD